jgi:hypothetical protein
MDILDKLREPTKHPGQWRLEAIEEIERLRKDLQVFEDGYSYKLGEIGQAKIDLGASQAREAKLRKEAKEFVKALIDENNLLKTGVNLIDRQLAEAQAREMKLIAFIRKWVDVGPDNKEMMEDLEGLELK